MERERGSGCQDVVDTNGAGDAFLVGLLAARLDGRSLEDGLRWAAAAGAIAVRSAELVAPELTRRAVQALAPHCEVSPVRSSDQPT